MEKNKFIYHRKYFDIMFFTFLIIVSMIPLLLGSRGASVVSYHFTYLQFILLPIAICYFLYRTNKYYENTFTIIRFDRKEEYKKGYFLENLKVIILIVSLYYADILLCCFEAELFFFNYFIVFYVLSIFIFLLIGQFNYFAYPVMKNKNRIYFYIILISEIFNMMLQIIPPVFSIDTFLDNQLLIITGIIILMLLHCMIVLINWKKEKIKKISKAALIIPITVSITCLLNITYQNHIVKSSLEFPTMFFVSINEVIVPLILWMLFIIFLVGIMLYSLLKNYQTHLLFYAIRISNRSKWFLRNVVKGMIPLIMVISVNYAINLLFHNNAILYIPNLIESILWISDISLLVFLFYQFIKNIKLINVMIIGFVILAIGSLSTSILDDVIFMRIHSVEMIMVLFVTLVILLIGNCYALNHLDYY